MSDIHALCSSIIESGRKYSKRHKSRSPLMYAYYQTEYLGMLNYRSASRLRFIQGTVQRPARQPPGSKIIALQIKRCMS